MTNDKDTTRLENFVLMVEDEIFEDIKSQASMFKNKELRDELKREESKQLVKVIVLKTMTNLQKKRAFKISFINKIFGREILEEDLDEQ
ncbi:hypothetical protein N9998_00340 [Nitrosopumilus sp.]|nr:hypothetical protein [Nitrosopumilus sp.]